MQLIKVAESIEASNIKHIAFLYVFIRDDLDKRVYFQVLEKMI